MTVSSHITSHGHGVRSTGDGVFRTLLDRLIAYREYRRTLRELSELSDVTLADLGLTRSMLRRVSWQACHND